tara:strand:- start:1192 stop:1317 length:126 start_codon:yes stop_codon:yes gene_type:complete
MGLGMAVLVGFVQVRYGQSWRDGLGELRRGWLRLGGAGYGG